MNVVRKVVENDEITIYPHHNFGSFIIGKEVIMPPQKSGLASIYSEIFQLMKS